MSQKNIQQSEKIQRLNFFIIQKHTLQSHTKLEKFNEKKVYSENLTTHFCVSAWCVAPPACLHCRCRAPPPPVLELKICRHELGGNDDDDDGANALARTFITRISSYKRACGQRQFITL